MHLDLDRHGGDLRFRQEWLDLGFHSRDLAGPDFTALLSGFHTPTDRPAPLTRIVRIVQTVVLPGSVASHATAAVLMGVPLPWRYEGGVGLLRAGVGAPRRIGTAVPVPSLAAGASLRAGARLPVVHVRTSDGKAPRSLTGVRTHRMGERPTLTIGGIEVSAPAELLCELAADLPWGDLVAAIDAIIGPLGARGGGGLPDIAGYVERRGSFRGAARLRRALGHAREMVRSPGESIMRLLVIGAGFPPPDANLPVIDPQTRQRRYLDLAWEAAMTALEYDGDGHRSTKQQWRRDEARRDELAALGWVLARSTGEDLAHPLRILLRLRRTLGERGLAVPSEHRIRQFVASLPKADLSLATAPRQPSA